MTWSACVQVVRRPALCKNLLQDRRARPVRTEASCVAVAAEERLNVFVAREVPPRSGVAVPREARQGEAWCPWPESNQHSLRNSILSRARLPVPDGILLVRPGLGLVAAELKMEARSGILLRHHMLACEKFGQQ